MNLGVIDFVLIGIMVVCYIAFMVVDCVHKE